MFQDIKTFIINQRLARVSLQSVGPVLHKWSADQKRIFNILGLFGHSSAERIIRLECASQAVLRYC